MLYTNDGKEFKDFQDYIPTGVKYPVYAKMLTPREEVVSSMGQEKKIVLYNILSTQYCCRVTIKGSEMLIYKGTKTNHPDGSITFSGTGVSFGTDGFLTIKNDEEYFCMLHHSMCLADKSTTPYREKAGSRQGDALFEIYDQKTKDSAKFYQMQREATFRASLFNMSEDKLRVAYINAGNGADENADKERMTIWFSNLASQSMDEAEKWIMSSSLGDSAILKAAIERGELIYVKKNGTFTLKGAKEPFFIVPEGMREKQDAFNSLLAYVDRGDSDKSILATLQEALK